MIEALSSTAVSFAGGNQQCLLLYAKFILDVQGGRIDCIEQNNILKQAMAKVVKMGMTCRADRICYQLQLFNRVNRKYLFGLCLLLSGNVKHLLISAHLNHFGSRNVDLLLFSVLFHFKLNLLIDFWLYKARHMQDVISGFGEHHWAFYIIFW